LLRLLPLGDFFGEVDPDALEGFGEADCFFAFFFSAFLSFFVDAALTSGDTATVKVVEPETILDSCQGRPPGDVDDFLFFLALRVLDEGVTTVCAAGVSAVVLMVAPERPESVLHFFLLGVAKDATAASALALLIFARRSFGSSCGTWKPQNPVGVLPLESASRESMRVPLAVFGLKVELARTAIPSAPIREMYIRRDMPVSTP